jgi:hypothetical protein
MVVVVVMFGDVLGELSWPGPAAGYRQARGMAGDRSKPEARFDDKIDQFIGRPLCNFGQLYRSGLFFDGQRIPAFQFSQFSVIFSDCAANVKLGEGSTELPCARSGRIEIVIEVAFQ